MKTILFIGVNGILGKYFCPLVSNKFIIHGTYYHNKPILNKRNIFYSSLDITKKDECKKIISRILPDIIIHAAALSDIDICENNKILAYKTNFIGTKNLVDNIKDTDIKFVFVSTSHVFNGKIGRYSENSKREPVDYYGYTKKMSEDYIINNCKNYLILRFSTIYGWNNPQNRLNIATFILNKLRAGKRIKMVKDRSTNFIYAENAAKALKKLINQNTNKKVFHIGGKELLSYYDFAEEVKNIFMDKTVNLINAKISNLRFLAKRPKKLYLDSTLVQKYIDFKPLSVKNGLRMMYKENPNY